MIRVKKIECTNHLLRNFGNKLKEVAKKTPPGCYRQAIENNIRRMRMGIAKAAEYRFNEHTSILQRQQKLYEDIMNVFGEHKHCKRIGYFCNGTMKENEQNIVPHLLNLGVYQKIQDILRSLAAHAESLLYRTNSNTVECFNAIIAKYICGKRINFGQRGSYTGRCANAVIQYNIKEVLSRLQRSCGKEPPQLLLDLENSKKKKKLTNAKKEKKSETKKKNFHASKDKDYGLNAQKPDMDEFMFDLQKEKHLEMLNEWQNQKEKSEQETIEQCKSRKWLAHKSKLLTASNFGKVCRRRKDTPCVKMVQSLLYPRVLNVPAVEYGRENEEIARGELSR
ncbi:uncharacterized protein LOC128885334 [Hylaeus anthracinus]|uniref:uncharacterized protein LOC128885334 n=1 Tax=Hylaeus anthracinus TaxID=313031 RepID=UPI0023BA0803|nr:uncharacterized protein LOC128885334 [Hylaeus anthracinus]